MRVIPCYDTTATVRATILVIPGYITRTSLMPWFRLEKENVSRGVASSRLSMTVAGVVTPGRTEDGILLTSRDLTPSPNCCET
jgi:uncharacterized membrane protein